MDRRSFLKAGSATAAVVPFAAGAAAQTAPATAAAGEAKLNALFEQVFQDRVQRYPELASSLGLDKGANAHLKSELDIRPLDQARKEDLALTKKNIADIKAVPPASLSDAGRLNGEVVVDLMESVIFPA
jgi:uncharacterized protein (DUF885 family)